MSTVRGFDCCMQGGNVTRLRVLRFERSSDCRDAGGEAWPISHKIVARLVFACCVWLVVASIVGASTL